YIQTNLVSDIPGLATTQDPNLVNPWGLARSQGSPWWVANNGTGTSTLYNGLGQRFPVGTPLVVTIPGAVGPGVPTGTVFNGSSDFQLTPNNPARFIFVGEDGTISGWNPAVNPTNAVIKVTSPFGTAIYKGVTLAQRNGANFLYVANFLSGKVDVFDGNFAPVALPATAFTDPSIPPGFAPFNVQNINGDVYVMFAMQDEAGEDEVAGPGLGFVDKFDANGVLLLQLNSGRWMNAPWGIALAPSNFGKESGRLLVGQFGSGEIATFDDVHGNFHGLLRGRVGHPLAIEGLWAIAFGNNGTAGLSNELFFTAGIQNEDHGLFGKITPAPKGKAKAQDMTHIDRVESRVVDRLRKRP
ncbi:MAG: TIGR03118 family protein, partial [Pyrinomonadaceae bacterium]